METKLESPIKVGYTVILKEDGSLQFDLLGTTVGLIELLGIHQYAALEIQSRIDQARFSGNVRIHEVGKAVALLNQKLDKLLQNNLEIRVE